jgi:hypothetical protein
MKWWDRWWNVSITLEKNFSFLSRKESIKTFDVLIKIMEANRLTIDGDELHNE